VTEPEPRIQLPAAVVAELTELLQFIDDWLGACHDRLREPFARFRRPSRLWHQPSARRSPALAFLLGADNSAQLFGNQ
jgi:hypothetical protein